MNQGGRHLCENSAAAEQDQWHTRSNVIICRLSRNSDPTLHGQPQGPRAHYESGAIGQIKRLLAVSGWLRNSRHNRFVIGRAVLTFGGLKAVPLFQTHIFADLYSLRKLSNAESHRAFKISP